MKFLCDNCKAKYQIPDEKVAGRTLRMKCRKCTHDIIIRGAGAAKKKSANKAKASKSASRSAAQRPSGRPSALGADFRRQVKSSSSHELPPTNISVPDTGWHVAINDVPVGPLKRAEMARKIGSGAVTGSSLVWREGLDEWRPLEEVAELATLLEQRRRPSVPAPPRGAAAPPPPVAGGTRGTKNRKSTKPQKQSRPSGPRTSRSGAFGLPTSDRSSPSVVPIASRRSQSSSGALSASDSGIDFDFADPSVPPPAAVPGVAPMAANTAPVAHAAPHEDDERDRGTPIWIWFMLAAGIVFGIVLGIKIPQLIGDDEPVAQAPTPTPPAIPETPPTPEPNIEIPEDVPVAMDAGVEDEEPEQHASNHSRHTSTTMSTAMTPSMTTTTRMTTSSSMGDFSAFTVEGSMGVTAPMLTTNTMTSNAAPLDSADVRQVVNRNRRQLQSCYERAARGQANPPNVRMNVSIVVGRSGTVTRATATGQDFGGLRSCIERSVRGWRFPASSNGGPARFPVVFSGR